MAHTLSGVMVHRQQSGAGRVLSVKGKILTIDLPHKLGAKFNCLFKFLFGLPV